MRERLAEGLYASHMTYIVTENGTIIAQFLRLIDANEFLSNLQYEDGSKLYEVQRPTS